MDRKVIFPAGRGGFGGGKAVTTPADTTPYISISMEWTYEFNILSISYLSLVYIPWWDFSLPYQRLHHLPSAGEVQEYQFWGQAPQT